MKERLDIVTEILEIMRKRFYLAERVYYHRAKVAASTIMCAILKKVGAPPDINPYADADEPSIADMTDDDLLNYLEEKLNTYVGQDRDELISMLRTIKRGRRDLYKSCIQMPYEFVSITSPLYPRLVTDYREGPDASSNIVKLENELSEVTEHRVLVYCPPTKMQAKEIDTLICLERDRVVPLKLHYKHLIISSEVEQLNMRYRGLWKFYVFMHPDDLKSKVIASQVISRFCTAIGISPDEAKKVAPYGFKTDKELRERYLHAWWKTERSWVTPEAFDDVEETVNDTLKWNEFVDKTIMKTPDCYFQQFDKIFLQAQLSKYLDTVEGKEIQKKKDVFEKHLVSEFQKNPAEWMIRIESSPSREDRQPPQGSGAFKAELEKFLAPEKSLDHYSKREQNAK